MGRIVGKGELCEALRWSRPRLEMRLDSDPKFPVSRRGSGNGVGRNSWGFDVDAVQAYLGGFDRGTDESGRDSDDDAGDRRATRNNAEAAGGAYDARERSARQRHQSAQAQMVESRLWKQCEGLIERIEMEVVVSTMVQQIERELNALPTMIRDQLGLEEQAVKRIQPLIGEILKAVATDLRPLDQLANAWPNRALERE